MIRRLVLEDNLSGVLGGVLRLMSYDNMTTVGRHISKNEVKLSEGFVHYAGECGS